MSEQQLSDAAREAVDKIFAANGWGSKERLAEWHLCLAGYLAGAESARRAAIEECAPTWIAIADKGPPKHGTQVLLYQPAAGGSKANLLAPLIRVGYAGDWPNRPPSHWMPLPEPPLATRSESARG